jgi:hypothetical protein
MLEEKDAKLALSVMDSRGTKYTVGAIYPPEIQKIMADKLKEMMVAEGMEPREPDGQMGFVFTLDEALDYFTRMKEIQNLIEAQERKQQEGSALD